ncbi:MAG: type II CAAX endopeptidase family protein [Verrucomicrobia bacterium]|nr:type II CAAX endopeptidase family protein [Verrucomicrobiota bacterium]MDA1069376.1 type II CAAX endopeptidase family protein [Verrucomicrobiota bacterium]
MTTEEVDPIILLIAALVFVTGTLCLIHHLFLKKKDYSQSEVIKLKPWKLKLLDQGIVLTFVYLFSFLAISLGIESYKLFKKVEEFPKENEFLLAFPMSIAMLLGLYGFYRYYNIKDDVPVNPEKHGVLTLFGKAFYFLLAVVPLMVVGSHTWTFILNHFNIPLDPQDLVTQVQSMSFSSTFVLLFLLAVVVAPITEELFFRAFVYRSLKSYFPTTGAAVVSSLIFALMHFNILSFVPLFILGFWLCRSYEDSGNIWVPIIVHGLFNGNTILVLTLNG